MTAQSASGDGRQPDRGQSPNGGDEAAGHHWLARAAALHLMPPLSVNEGVNADASSAASGESAIGNLALKAISNSTECSRFLQVRDTTALLVQCSAPTTQVGRHLLL